VRAPLLLALASLSSIASFLWACDSFDSTDDPPLDDGGTGVDAFGGLDADTGASVDDGGLDATTGMGTHAARCPRPPGPTMAPSVAPRIRLYAPADAGTEYPFGITTDSKFVYWTTMSFEMTGDAPYDGAGTAKIMRVDRSGANAKATVIATSQRRALSIAIAGDHVYWAALDGTKPVLRRARRDCAANCTVEPVIALGSGGVLDLVEIDGTHLLASDLDQNVHVVDLSVPTVVDTQFMSDYPAVTSTSTRGFAASAFASGMYQVTATAPAAFTPFATVPDSGDPLFPGMSPITTDCNTVYGWRGSAKIWKIGADGGVATAFASPPINAVFGLDADQKYLYTAAPDGPGAIAIPIAGGSAETISPGNVFRIAVDDVGVYWGDHDRNSGGAIWMMVK
jgi:hypothetical protein